VKQAVTIMSIMFDGPPLEHDIRTVDRFAVKSVGGMGLGAGPLISAVALKGNIKGFYIRKKAKQNGIGKRVEGHFEPPALVLDDVINKGNSVMKAIDIIGRRYIGGVVCIVDRRLMEICYNRTG
jgi:orotate phosphoribosyltransferase